MRRQVLTGLSLTFWTLLAGATAMQRPVHAQALKSASDYSKDETRRALQDSIKRAKQALQTLEKPPQELRLPQGLGPVEPRISNGIGSIRYPATGALLKGDSAQSAKLYCTGTLIACDKFLVAAHCVVQDPDPGQYYAYFQVGGVFKATKVEWPTEIYRYPESKADLAVVTLEKPVEGIAPERIGVAAKTPYNTAGTIVGFGRTGGDRFDYGIKREGYVQTARCTGGRSDDALICWNFSALTQNGARRSDTCNADSGGPLFVLASANNVSTQTVAGVTGGGDASSNCLIGDHAYDTSLFNNRTWLQGAGIAATPPATCSAAANVDVAREVVGMTFTLNDSDATQSVRQIDVAANVKKLMVAMNAEDDGYGKNDFNLYVIPGPDPNIAKAVCKEDGSGQFGFCSIASPKPGKWTLMVRRKSGAGMGQLVVTRIIGNPQ